MNLLHRSILYTDKKDIIFSYTYGVVLERSKLSEPDSQYLSKK